MANDEHVALLKQGVAAWNAWRREHPDIRPNLSGAYLADAHLTDDHTQSDLIDASVHMTMTARARPNSVIISLRKSSPMARLVSHQTFQPSASSIATSFDASDRSVLA